jgi:hypothetical protein
MGKKALIVTGLYDLKSAGAAFRNHYLALCMTNLGYTWCLADPDVWLQPKVCDDGFAFYECILIDIDNILAV